MPPIVRSAATGEIQQIAIDESGLPLGIMEDYEYESVQVELGSGDMVVMYTDGINEAMNSDGMQLTTEKMIQEIQEGQAKSPEAVGEQICQAVARHAGLEPAIDDMCLVCIGRTA
jgi:serine phosphatase RsbU (regulator of sigma subunit)